MKEAANKRAGEWLELDDWGIRRRWGSETVEAVAWADLAGIWIFTTDDGPMQEDLYWMFQARSGGGCAVTSTLAERSDLIDGLSRRFGEAVDFEAVIQAACCTEVKCFWVYPKGQELREASAEVVHTDKPAMARQGQAGA